MQHLSKIYNSRKPYKKGYKIEKLSIKTKTLLFISTIIFISFGMFFYVFYQYKKDELNKITAYQYKKIENSFHRNIERNIQEHYINVAEKFITTQMLEAIAQNDREKLLEFSKDSYNTLKLTDRYLEQFHFHRKDGTTLLRLHRVEFFDDDIAQKRPMARDTHTKKIIHTGFEVGMHGVSYRVFIPLFYKESYLGAFEIGISPSKILDIVTYFNKIDALIRIHNNSLLDTNTPIEYEQVVENNLLRLLPNSSKLPKQFQVAFDGKHISVATLDILDYSQKSIGQFIFFQDLTNEQDNYYNLIQNMLLIFIISIGVTFIVINFGFNMLISKLENSYDKLQQYTKLVDETVITSSTDLEGNIVSISKAFSEISGYSKKELLGKNHRIIKHKDMNPDIYTQMWLTLQNNQVWSGEIKNQNKEGGFYWVYATISPTFDKFGTKVGYTAIRQNITNKKLIEDLSIRDGLTDIFNRRYFNEMFPKIINGAKRKNLLVCMILLDIDYFKGYNDNYGHSMGDIALTKIANCLKDSLKRSDDLAFRLGGEEFAIIFIADDREKAFDFANTIRKNIESLHIEHKFSSVNPSITASFGLVCKRAIEIYNKDTIYKEADDALYEAKKTGRNKVIMTQL